MSRRSTAVLTAPAWRDSGLDWPRPDVFASPARNLPTHAAGLTPAGSMPGWFFIAAHGGSGANLLAQLSWQPYEATVRLAHQLGTDPDPATLPAFGVSAGRAWPTPALEPTPLCIVVCQTTMRGLAWARDVAAQYLSGGAPPRTRLVGVVTVADQPGRLPTPITAAKNLLAGVYANTWHIPYVPAYRLLTARLEDSCPPVHPGVDDVMTAIRSTIHPEGDRA